MSVIKHIENNCIPEPTHRFVYKGKRFPFNFDMFALNSTYFKENRKELYSKEEIALLLGEDENNINIEESSINLFISFIYNKGIDLTKDNILSLHYLSQKYGIPNLINETEKFIHENNLSLQFLLFYQNKPDFSLVNFIDNLSENFLDYLHDETIFNLNFPILFSIIEKVKNKRSSSELFSNDEFINFLFTCLDKYKRTASILFNDVDFKSLPMIHFQRLLSYDKSKFDHVFINDQMLRSVYDKQGEIAQKEEEIKLKEIQMEEKMNRFESLISSFEEKIRNLEEEKERMDREYRQQINALNEQLQHAKMMKELKFEYDQNGNNAFDGIINHLASECGGNVHDKRVVDVSMPSIYSGRSAKNAANVNDQTNYAQSDNQENAYLRYDFNDRKVRPTHYSIRSRHDYGKGIHNLQHWVIEGSNTGTDDFWTVLDQRQDVKCLDEMSAVGTFDIQSPNGIFYRYLRIRQTGKDTSNGYSYLTLSALEFFGTLIE